MSFSDNLDFLAESYLSSDLSTNIPFSDLTYDATQCPGGAKNQAKVVRKKYHFPCLTVTQESSNIAYCFSINIYFAHILISAPVPYPTAGEWRLLQDKIPLQL